MKTGVIIGAAVVVLVVLGGILLMTGSDKGTLVMKITDAPADLNIEKAEVVLSEVQVHYAGKKGNETEENWITVVSGPKTFDLVALRNVTEILGSSKLDAGKYTQIRLNVDSAVAVIDGKEQELTIPSKNIKLIKPFDVAEGETITLILDFDAQESIKVTGRDNYVMSPVIKVIQE
jgi:hypothetical protein